MAECGWEIKDPKTGSVTSEKLVSEPELDIYLKKYYDKLSDGYTLSKIFDVDLKTDVKTKLSKIQINAKELKAHPIFAGMEGDSIKLHDHPDYIGVTEMLYEIGNPKVGNNKPLVEKLDLDSYKLNRTKYWTDLGKSEEAAKELTENEIKSWDVSAEYGDEIHSIFQSVFEDKTLPVTKLLSESQVDYLRKEAVRLKQSLIEKYGAGSEFYSEISIATTDIDSDLKEILKNKNKKGISGTIDLLVVAEDGSTHIYDFKTSKHTIGEWDVDSKDGWHSKKKLAITNQLAAYNVLLEQVGIHNSTTHIVPIKLDFEYQDEEKTIISGLSDYTMENILDNVPKTTQGNIYNSWKIFIPKPFKFNTDSIIDIDKKVTHMLPIKSWIDSKLEVKTGTVDYYRKRVYTIPENSWEREKGKYKFTEYGIKSTPTYYKNEQELEEGLNKYVEDLKSVRANEVDSIAVNLTRVLAGDMELETFADSLTSDSKDFVLNTFRRYVDDGWNFVRNKDLNAYGIFIFQKDGRSEIIGLTNDAIGTQMNLGLGKSILGKTRPDSVIDSKRILSATIGNMELMRIMTYVAENQDSFKDNKITQIRVVNPWRGRENSALTSKLVENYNLLVQDNDATFDGNLKYINSNIFWGDVVSLLSVANDLIQTATEKSYGLYDFKMEGLDQTKNTIYTEQWINNAIRKLVKNYDYLQAQDNTGRGDPAIWEAYYYLNQALLAVSNMSVVQEFDVDMWLNAKVTPGTAIASTSYSPSANIRQFDDIMQQFATDVRVEVEKLGRPVMKSLKSFYDSKNKSTVFRNESNYFLEWFRKNPDGSISEEFKLLDPSDPSLSKESSAALDTWLKTMAKLRWPKATEEEIKKFKDSEKYYEVPLTEAAFSRQLKNVGFKVFKNKFEQYAELTADVFAGDTEQKEKWIQKYSHLGLYNKFNLDPDQRSYKIQKHGVGFFETNLEIVMNQALVAYTKQEASKKYIPRIKAVQTCLKMAQTYGGQIQQNTSEALDKLIKSKFYGESIIPGGTMQAFARWLNVIKHGLSFMALGFNLRSFTREFLQGTWMGINRAGLNNMPGINEKTYLAAYEHVLMNAHKNFSSVSLLQQLDARYGVANYSLNNISRKRRLNWYGIRNWNTDTAFWGSTAPDFQHRMTILVAKMMGDGSWQAYSLNKDGDLIYDWKKDKRFSVYADPNANKQSEEYINQRALYMQYIAELNRIGKQYNDNGVLRQYKEGDELPEAYSSREIQALKSYSDLLYGHYDDESRSLINDMFLGSFFMQYKTYITSRVEQWTLSPGTYNTEFLEWEVDPVTKQKLYRVHGDLDEEGKPDITIKTKAQIGADFDRLVSENRIEPLYVWKGMPMEGIARSYINFFKDIKSMGWDAFKNLKNNPIQRDNMLMGLHDTLFASFMMLLITGIFGLLIDGEWTTDHAKIAKEARKNGWLDSFTYNVSYGSFTDFSPWKNAWSMVGDWNPPALTSAIRVVNNAGAVIMGNKSIFQAVTNTVGAAGDLKGLADKFADK